MSFVATLFLALVITRCIIWAIDIASWSNGKEGNISWDVIISVGGLSWIVGLILALHILGWLPKLVF